MAQLWGGRFTKETDRLVYQFNASISFDQRLYRQDAEGSMAHVRMLKKQGILTEEEQNQILQGLQEILADVESGKLTITDEYEDIHSFMEANLIDRIGDAGKKLPQRSGGAGYASLHKGRGSKDRWALAGSFKSAAWDYGETHGDHHAGLHASAESTAYYTGSSYGGLF